MNILLIIAAIFIATETINPEVDEGKEIQKKEVVVETVETKQSEEIISEAQAAAENINSLKNRKREYIRLNSIKRKKSM